MHDARWLGFRFLFPFVLSTCLNCDPGIRGFRLQFGIPASDSSFLTLTFGVSKDQPRIHCTSHDTCNSVPSLVIYHLEECYMQTRSIERCPKNPSNQKFVPSEIHPYEPEANETETSERHPNPTQFFIILGIKSSSTDPHAGCLAGCRGITSLRFALPGHRLHSMLARCPVHLP